ncbi:MAG: hypothetical protein K8F91_09585, partial [Candidatus Obscuribacterales bacterium]|nr:hypothetical protein [Candidatus Obscuribacterales bacterium]
GIDKADTKDQSDKSGWSAPDRQEKNAGDDSQALTLSGTVSADYEKSNHLANQLLKKELELLKLNTDFRILTTKQGKWKRWRTFAYNMGASAVSFSGITTISAENWRTWRKPARANRTVLKAGPILLLIGHCIGLSGALIEGTLDKHEEYQNWKKGLSPAAHTEKVLTLKKEIDDLYKERETLLAASTSLNKEQKELALAESKVLKGIRDQGLIEYANFYIRARKRAVARDFEYLNTIGITTTGGFQGSLNGLMSVEKRDRKYAQAAGLGFLESGSLIVLAPWMSKGTQIVTGKIVKKNIKKKLGDMGDTSLEKLTDNLDDLKKQEIYTEKSQRPKYIEKRLAAYDAARQVFSDQSQFNAGEKKKGDSAWRERVLFNTIVGGTKMAWGTNLAYGGFRYAGKSVKTNPRNFSKFVAIGSTCYVAGTGTWMFDALQSRTRGEMDLFTMGTQQATPIHKLNRRMTSLTQIENDLGK